MKRPLVTAALCALTALVTYLLTYFQLKGLS
jgi:hypothetical protein